jgi:hypothetical protein
MTNKNEKNQNSVSEILTRHCQPFCLTEETRMPRKRTLTSLLAVIAAVGFVATDRTLAAEPRSAAVRVISSDATAAFVQVTQGKSVVIDLPGDIKDVLVADPTIVRFVVQSIRRVYLVGGRGGMTNVYFYAADGRQITALNVAVTTNPQNDIVFANALPAKVITIYSGPLGNQTSYSCTSTKPQRCITPEVFEAANTTHSVSTVINR